MKYLVYSITALYAILAFFGVARAERVVGLEEAVSMALEGNPGLRATENSVNADTESIGVARSRLLPSVRFEERYMRTDNPTYAFSSRLGQGRFRQEDFALDALNHPDDIGDYQSSVSFEQIIYSRDAYVGLGMAKTDARASEMDFIRKKESVALQTVSAYINVRVAGEMLRAAERAVEDAREHKRTAAARFEAALGLYSDTLRTDVLEKEAEERLISAENALDVAKRALGLAMGLDEPVGIREEEKASEIRGLDYYLAAATDRSDIGAMELRAENAQSGVKLATAKYLPRLGVGGSYQFNDHEKPFGSEGESYQVAAFLRWDLLDGGLRRHERAAAKFRAREAEEYLDGLRKETSFRVHEAYLKVEESAKGLELARSRAALAQEAARLTARRYENSLSTVSELLDAQASLDAARADVAEKTGRHLVTVAALHYQSGLILKEFIPVH